MKLAGSGTEVEFELALRISKAYAEVRLSKSPAPLIRSSKSTKPSRIITKSSDRDLIIPGR